MAARSFAPSDRDLRGLHTVARATAHARKHILRRRLAVVAPRVVDAVRHTGGWLYDQVAAGWEVVVVVPGSADLRPLEILGASAVDLEAALSSSPHGPMPDTVAVAAELYDSDDRIREGLHALLEESPTVLALWGDTVPVDLDSRFVSTRSHQLSRAAQVFKSHALAAASVPKQPVGRTESFRAPGLDASHSRGNLLSMA